MEAMMAVTKAQEEGRISKRNALKLDLKINQNIEKLLRETPHRQNWSLVDKIEASSYGIKAKRTLPPPEQPLPRKDQVHRPAQNKRMPRDLERWQ